MSSNDDSQANNNSVDKGCGPVTDDDASITASLVEPLNEPIEQNNNDELFPPSSLPSLICDMGYGLPREARPRKEKILAISRQIVNFLEWQIITNNTMSMSSPMKNRNNNNNPALVQIVGCPDEATKSALQDRMLKLMNESNNSKLLSSSSSSTWTELPSNVSISCDSLEDTCAAIINNNKNNCSNSSSCCCCDNDEIVYLSPDASETLQGRPPKVVIVGLLIDRRVQPNRSKHRAMELELIAKRWPLDECFADMDPNEPLNVDCVLEGMQQWWWNVQKRQEIIELHQQQDFEKYSEDDKNAMYREAFVQAAAQAIQHHAQRHPSRPMHLSNDK